MRKEHSNYSSREEKKILGEAIERADLKREELVDLLLLLIRMSEDASPDYSFSAAQIAYLISSGPSEMVTSWRSYEDEAEEEFKRYYASQSGEKS